jgi:type VI protein secretion system component VasA
MFAVMQLPRRNVLSGLAPRAAQPLPAMSEVALLPQHRKVVAHRHRNLTKQQQVVAMIATPTKLLERVRRQLHVLA